MLFNSYEFLLCFLPATLLGFYLISAQGGRRAGVAWLVLASLFFYGWWNPKYVFLLLMSLTFNYSVAVTIANTPPSTRRTGIFIFGIVTNLAVLGYFKYANFFVSNIGLLTGTDYALETIILPLGISFYTFQKIAFLVDAYRGETKEFDFLRYCLFVTFFPQLIAGPIVHHQDVIPQFARPTMFRFSKINFSVGLTIFIIGLFKKSVLADDVAVYANPIFSAAQNQQHLAWLEVWFGALAYTLQLYFDFSGYSDMAIGLARMFNVRLPMNFHSPYKAINIVDFWRRWHMTLSRFLRDYVYISLGGNRRGLVRRYLNLWATMLIGGLWHGAGWTFIAWGALHGSYLVINHAWHWLQKSLSIAPIQRWYTILLARTITFIAVVIGWVLFRAESFSSAWSMLQTMFAPSEWALPEKLHHFLGPVGALLESHGLTFVAMPYLIGTKYILVLLLVAWFAPNTQEIMRRFRPTLKAFEQMPRSKIAWRPNIGWGVALGILAAIAVLNLDHVTEFLYFQF